MEALNGRQNGTWTTVSAISAATLPVTPYNNLNTTNVQSQLRELEDEKVSISGGTVTGGLGAYSLNVVGQPYANLGFFVNSSASTNARWVIRGSDGADSSLEIYSYDDTGTYVGAPLSINRLSGISTIASIVTYGLTAFGTSFFAPGLSIGSTAASGIFGDGNAVALRGYGNNAIYYRMQEVA